MPIKNRLYVCPHCYHLNKGGEFRKEIKTLQCDNCMNTFPSTKRSEKGLFWVENEFESTLHTLSNVAQLLGKSKDQLSASDIKLVVGLTTVVTKFFGGVAKLKKAITDDFKWKPDSLQRVKILLKLKADGWFDEKIFHKHNRNFIPGISDNFYIEDFYYPDTYHPIYRRFRYLPNHESYFEVWNLLQVKEAVDMFGARRCLRFRVNDKITLKLERRRTNLYVNDRLFNQCKTLLINIPKDRLREYDELDSIDEIAENVTSLEMTPQFMYEMSPYQEFWAHCSNIQAWVENDYDTRLLHRNIAFPLLRKLADLGDKKALRILKEEIIQRWESGYGPVREFLLQEGYLDYFTLEEQEILKGVMLEEQDTSTLAELEQGDYSFKSVDLEEEKDLIHVRDDSVEDEIKEFGKKLIQYYQTETGKYGLWRGFLTEGFKGWLNKKIGTEVFPSDNAKD